MHWFAVLVTHATDQFSWEKTSYLIVSKNLYAGLHLDSYRPVSFKLDMVALNSTFDTTVDDFDLHPRSQLYEKSKTCVLIFLKISQSILMKFSLLPQAHAEYSSHGCHFNFQWRELSFCDFVIIHTSNAGLCLDNLNQFVSDLI